MGVDRSEWPLMVRIALWGLPSRGAAWIFVWLSLAIAAGGVVYGFVNPLGFIGGLMAFAAPWYYLAIRWVDRHSRWSYCSRRRPRGTRDRRSSSAPGTSTPPLIIRQSDPVVSRPNLERYPDRHPPP